jgi:TIR domain
MNVFLSHARKDAGLARQLAARLARGGFSVWLPEEQIEPGDNWAKKIGKALEDSQIMVILLTPRALESDLLRQDIDFALFSRKYEGRVFSVFVGPTPAAGKDTPWILVKLPHRQVDSARDFGQVVKDIQALCADSAMSHSHA